MGNPLSDFLTTNCGSSLTPKDDGYYRHLAKQAADALVSDGADMSETIRKLASENDLNSEQTRRVVEYANNTAFSQIFEKDPGYVTFDVADAGKAMEKTASAVIPETPRYIPFSDVVDAEKLAQEMFGDRDEDEKIERQKVATEMLQEARMLRENVEDAQTTAIKKVAQMQQMVQKMVDFEEAAPDDIQKALEHAGVHSDLVKAAMGPVEGAQMRPMFDTSQIPNDNHPLMILANEAAEAGSAFVRAKQQAAVRAKEMLDGGGMAPPAGPGPLPVPPGPVAEPGAGLPPAAPGGGEGGAKVV